MRKITVVMSNEVECLGVKLLNNIIEGNFIKSELIKKEKELKQLRDKFLEKEIRYLLISSNYGLQSKEIISLQLEYYKSKASKDNRVITELLKLIEENLEEII